MRDSQPVLRASDLAPQETTEPGEPGGETAGQPSASPPQLLRELPVAGRRITVLYWEGVVMERGETVSAEAAVPGGGSYVARMFYSCETAVCAGARIELSALDGEGRELTRTSAPLSQEAD